MGWSIEQKSEYMALRYANQKLEFIQYLGGECLVCGSKDNLEFDHIDWTQKSFTVSRLYGLKRLPEAYAELDKCQLLCKEHHLQKTRADLIEQSALKTFTHGSSYGWMKRKCTCDLCDKARRAFYDKRNAERRAAYQCGAVATQ